MPVYDFPSSLVPRDSKVYGLTSRFSPGVTLSGATSGTPEPNGLMAIDLAFNTLKSAQASLDYAWLLDRLQGGAGVFLISLTEHVETVSRAALGLGPSGTPVSLDADEDADEGAKELVIDMSPYGQVLQRGHLIGVDYACNRVMDIDYAGSIATAELLMPLRADVDSSTVIRLWPKMKCQADPPSIASFRTRHLFGRWTQPGNLTMVEYVGP